MREKNYIYVDKTDLIYEIVKLNTAFIMNAERRTGKTLLLSTIKTIFQEPKSWWEEYGKNLKILQLDPNFFDKNPYPVIHFDFSQSSSNISFIDRVREGLNDTISNYHLPLKDIERSITLQKLIDVEFADILKNLKNIYKKPAVVIIDEADQPLINQIFDDRIKDEIVRSERMSETIGSFKEFYGYLQAKLASQNLRLVFIVGHSRIMKSMYFGSSFDNI